MKKAESTVNFVSGGSTNNKNKVKGFINNITNNYGLSQEAVERMFDDLLENLEISQKTEAEEMFSLYFDDERKTNGHRNYEKINRIVNKLNTATISQNSLWKILAEIALYKFNNDAQELLKFPYDSLDSITKRLVFKLIVNDLYTCNGLEEVAALASLKTEIEQQRLHNSTTKARKVFIAYSTKDSTVKNVAEAVISKFKKDKTWCTGYNNILEDAILYKTSLAEAIENSDVFVLCVSNASGRSLDVMYECAVAIKQKKTILPYLIEITESEVESSFGLYYGTLIKNMKGENEALKLVDSKTSFETIKKHLKSCQYSLTIDELFLKINKAINSANDKPKSAGDWQKIVEEKEKEIAILEDSRTNSETKLTEVNDKLANEIKQHEQTKKELRAAEEKLSDNADKIEKLEKQLADGVSDNKRLNSQIKIYQDKIKEAETQITGYKAEIEKAKTATAQKAAEKPQEAAAAVTEKPYTDIGYVSSGEKLLKKLPDKKDIYGYEREVYTFGHYPTEKDAIRWLKVDEKNGAGLFVTERILDCRQYHHTTDYWKEFAQKDKKFYKDKEMRREFWKGSDLC
ncbi:MAG: TIR domain-containing protein, partial [Clostridiales bacterium]|nr:TIR domain-containing protein [Clostridiales bacterium]